MWNSSEQLFLLQTRGWCIAPAVMDAALVAALRREIDQGVADCVELQRRKGLITDNNGASHHVLVRGGSFLDFLRRRYLVDVAGSYLRGKVILNSYGANVNERTTSAYYQNVHRDVRFFVPNYPTMVTMIVAVDEFTADNGGTWLLPGSHHAEEKPSDEFFKRHALQLVVPAGSVAMFDSCVWHAAGVNRGDSPRRAMTLTFTRPFYKQQFDYPRALGDACLAELDAATRELIGYDSRIPASLDEWYRPPAERFYKADQV